MNEGRRALELVVASSEEGRMKLVGITSRNQELHEDINSAQYTHITHKATVIRLT